MTLMMPGVVGTLGYLTQSNVAKDLRPALAGPTKDTLASNLTEQSLTDNAMRPTLILIQTWLPSPLPSHRALQGQYMVMLEEDEDGGFVATIPTLRGCISEGGDEDQALAYLKDALDGWLHVAQREGLRIPPPDKVRSL